MLPRTLGASFLLGLTLLAFPATAQQPSASQSAVPMFSLSDNAKFMRVDEGIFEIQVGRTIDLTDKKITFMISKIEDITHPEGAIVIAHFAGNSSRYAMASRIDLKQIRREDLKDYKVCYLDLIRVTEARGAPPSATFRMECH